MSKAAIADLTDWDVVNILFRPGTAEARKKGYYWPAPVWVPEKNEGFGVWTDFKAAALYAYRELGMTDSAEMEARFQRDYPGYERTAG